MTMPSPTYHCARCGGDIENDNVLERAYVSDAVKDENGSWELRNLRFCRVPNPGAPNGCADHVLSPSNLAAHHDAVG